MRKIIVGIATAMLLFSTAACNDVGKVADKPVVTVTQTAPNTVDDTLTESTPTLSQSETDDLFIKVLEDEHPEFAGAENELIDLGHTICDSFDQGAKFNDAARILLDNGLNTSQAGYIIGASIAAYCPQHSNLLDK